jgi:HD-GYP domain-containing protein (c-di-GMP phosphodiesterase class II)
VKRSRTLHYRGLDLDTSFIPTVLDATEEYARRRCRATAEWSEGVARELGLADEDVRPLRIVALLHLVDRLGVPAEEYDVCRLTEAESAALGSAPEILGPLLPADRLSDIVDALSAIHERYDGSGRPAGLAGQDIPPFARIVSAVSSFLELTMERPGYGPLLRPVAVEHLQKEAGVRFDPAIVQALADVVASEEQDADQDTEA